MYRGGGGDIWAPEAGDLMRSLQELSPLPGRTQVQGEMLWIFGYCMLDINTCTRGHHARMLSLDLRDQPVSNIASPEGQDTGQISSQLPNLEHHVDLILTLGTIS